MIKPENDWPRGVAPPEPPPMRGGRQSPDVGGMVVIIIIAFALGIASGWQMHGGICS